MNPRNFFAELKRRNVSKVAVAYAVIAWLLIQAGSILFPTFEAPGWVMKVFVTVIAAGFPIALVIAWAFEMTPEGMKRTENVSPNEHIPQWSKRKFVALIVSLAIAAAGLLLFQLMRWNPAATAGPGTQREAIPEKSIAVLPFQNLSANQENAFFTDGVQDEILTDLAKIADLKVISRTSVMSYKTGSARNLRQIGQQLGVAHLLEGSVQRAGGKIRVNAQLIDARTDNHLWGQTYDRDLADVFAIQSEIAKAIADALQAKLTGQEKTTLERKPTTNLEAYDCYLRGLAFSQRFIYQPEDNLNAIKYFHEAVKVDPKFALAWAWLAHENALGYFNEVGNDLPALRAAAKRAADQAIELQPDLGEAYLAQGYFQYYCERDYDSAIGSFQKAGQLSPNNSQVPLALGRVHRRKGDWQRSLEYYQQAIELDPRDVLLLGVQIEILENLRQYTAALKACDRILEIIPGNSDTMAIKAGLYQAEGNLPAAAAFLSSLHADTNPRLFSVKIAQAFYERRYPDAIAALKAQLAKPDSVATEWMIQFKAALAQLQQLSGDAAAARNTWEQVRSEAEVLRRTKKYSPFDSLAASAYVALGDKATAFAIVKESMPKSNDLLIAVRMPETMAQIAVEAGDKDLALEQLAICARSPISVSVNYGDLKLSPEWDALRGDPRFEKIVASLAPK